MHATQCDEYGHRVWGTTKANAGLHINTHWMMFLTASISIFQFFNYFIRAPNTITAKLHKSRWFGLRLAIFLIINAVTRARAESWTWIDWSIMQRSGKREFIDCGAGEMQQRGQHARILKHDCQTRNEASVIKSQQKPTSYDLRRTKNKQREWKKCGNSSMFANFSMCPVEGLCRFVLARNYFHGTTASNHSLRSIPKRSFTWELRVSSAHKKAGAAA